jgi:hypothetical protein
LNQKQCTAIGVDCGENLMCSLREFRATHMADLADTSIDFNQAGQTMAGVRR